MATAIKKSVVPLKVSTPVEAAVAAFKAVQPSEVKPVAAPAALAAAPAAIAAAPAAEIQQSFSGALEKGVIESRAAFAKAKTKADEATSALEASFAAAKDGAFAINTKAFEAMRFNADANFDFWKAVFAAKSQVEMSAGVPPARSSLTAL